MADPVLDWTTPWKDLWDDSYTKKAATGVMNVVRDTAPKLEEIRRGNQYVFNRLISPGTRNLGEDLTKASRFLTRTGTRDLRRDISSLGQGVSDYTKKYVTDPEGWKDLGKEIIDVIATPVDTAAALASGMATSVAAPYAALPTLLRSDDPLTREGSKEWVDKMHSVAESIPTYHARTRFGKKLTEGIGSAWEQWNNEVAAKVGVGVENALKYVGVDYKSAERAGALTSGVVGAVPAVPSALRVRGSPTSLPVRGTEYSSIRNARINQIANIADPNFMARMWMQLDPVGFAKAKADGTLDKKLSDMGWEFTDHITNIPVRKEQLGAWKRNEASGELEYHSDRLGEFRPAGRDYPGRSTALQGKEEIALDPIAIKLAKEQYRETGTAGHEMHHAMDRHAYKQFAPESDKMFNEWLDEQAASGREVGKEEFTDLVDEYLKLGSRKRPYGYLSEELQGVVNLSAKIREHEVMSEINTRQALETPVGEDPQGWYPPPPTGYGTANRGWSYEAWKDSIEREVAQTAKPLEISARLDGLQRFLKENDMHLEDVFTKFEHTGPGNWQERMHPKLAKAPTDVKQLIRYLNDLLLDKYGKLQRADVARLPPIDVERVGKHAGQTSTSNLNKLKALHDGRIGAATKYVMDMLTEAIAETQITLPRKYKLGFPK